MGKLYGMPLEDVNPEVTGSLARSFKDGLILPFERKFTLLEKEFSSLKEHFDIESLQKKQQLTECMNLLQQEIAELKKISRLGNYITILSLAGIISLLMVLFFWH